MEETGEMVVVMVVEAVEVEISKQHDWLGRHVWAITKRRVEGKALDIDGHPLWFCFARMDFYNDGSLHH